MIQSEVLGKFEEYLQFERRYSAHTIEAYLRDCQQFVVYLADQYQSNDLAAVNHHYARSWVVSLLKKKTNPTSVRRKLSSLSHLYKWMRRMDLVAHNPIHRIQLPKTAQRLPKSLSAGSIHQLWDSMPVADQSLDYDAIRDMALLGLLYGCGLRRSELIKAAWPDFDESRMVLRVLGKGRKYRLVPVNPQLANVLGVLKEKAKNLWDTESHIEIILMGNGKPCYPKFVHNKVVALLGTVTTAERKSPHVLRHSMATHMMDQGAELNAVKGILGHASLAATQVYTHNSISRIKEVYSQSHPNAKREE